MIKEQILLLAAWFAIAALCESFAQQAIELAPGESVTIRAAGESPDDRSEQAYRLHDDAKAVYVDSDGGSDTADGLTQDTAVQTLFEGTTRLEDGAGDHLLLERGDRWDGEYFPLWQVSGFDADYPCVIGAYGEGPRPVVAPSNRSGFEHMTKAVHDVAIIGIRFEGPENIYAKRSAGVSTLGPMARLTIRGCDIVGFGMNVNANTFRGQIVEDLIIEDCLIADSINMQQRSDGTWALKHSSGLFLNAVQGVELRDNYIVGNGWREDVGRSPLNHGVYAQYDCTGFEASGNLVAFNSTNGFMARAGGVIKNNVLAGNASNVFGKSFDPRINEVLGPWSGSITGNLVIGTEFNGLAWGWVIHEAADVEVRDNMFLNASSTERNTRGIHLSQTVYDIVIENNWVQNHGHAIDAAPETAQNVSVTGNTFIATEDYEAVRVRGAGADGLALGNNTTATGDPHPYTLPSDFENLVRSRAITAAEIIAAARGAEEAAASSSSTNGGEKPDRSRP